MTAITWRPDGKVLAIGHSDGSVALIDVEDGEELFGHPPSGSPVRALYWGEREWPGSASSTAIGSSSANTLDANDDDDGHADDGDDPSLEDPSMLSLEENPRDLAAGALRQRVLGH